MKSTQLQAVDDNSMWDNPMTLKDIKAVYQKKASDSEFKVFCEMGKATGLNPFLGELWLVKYDPNSPAQIFVGRDGYRKSIRRNPEYEGHHVESVYSNEEFNYDYQTGQVTHKKNFNDRGKLVGAYCLCDMKGKKKPYYVWVDLAEYSTGKSTWSKMPATMIKKVAEAQCLRMASPEIFNGSYDESEYEVIAASKEKEKPTDKLARILETKEVQKPLDEVMAIIESANTIEELNVGAAKAKDLVSVPERNAARKAYKDRLAIIKEPEHDTQTGEIIDVEVMEDNSIFAKVEHQLKSAKSKDTLDLAADLIRECSESEQEALKTLYAYRCKDFA